MDLHQILSEAWTFLCENNSDDSEGCSYGQLVIGCFITTTCLLIHHIPWRVFWQNIKSPRWLSPLQLRFGTLRLLAFPKLKSPLKGNRYQTINEIQDNLIRQLMVIGRTVWGLEVPTLKGTEASLSYVQCFLYLGSSSINVSIFHITWLDTFWTDLIYLIEEETPRKNLNLLRDL